MVKFKCGEILQYKECISRTLRTYIYIIGNMSTLNYENINFV